jgi:hypothetical protein
MGRLSGIHFFVPCEHVQCDCELLMGLTFKHWHSDCEYSMICENVIKTMGYNGWMVLSSFGKSIRSKLEEYGSLIRIVVRHKRDCTAVNQYRDDFELPIAFYYDTHETCSWSYGDILLNTDPVYFRGINPNMTGLIQKFMLNTDEIINLANNSYFGINVFVA